MPEKKYEDVPYKVEVPEKNNDIQISKNFKLSEFIVSDKFPELAKKIIPTEEQIKNIKNLVISIIQPVRDDLNEPVDIESGIRDDDLNNAVHGHPTTDHKYGGAGDITSDSIRKNEKEIAYKIWDLDLPIRQIIYYPGRGFIHISINFEGKEYKHELLRYENKTYYKEIV